MNVSPSPSPRRLQRQRPVSPLATQPRNSDDDSSVDAIGTNSSNGTSSNGRAVDQGAFHQVSLSDGRPTLPPANPSSNLSSRSSPPSQRFTHSYSKSYSHSSNSYGRSSDLGDVHDRDNNYGYRPRYKDDASAPSNNKIFGTSASHRPVQEYHNAFSDAVPLDSPLSLPPPPSTSGPSSPASKFATFSSASRAFLEHRRNQSIPNLMPTISSIGRNLGRAISPDRPLQPFQLPKRPPIPEYKEERSSRRESYSGDDSSEDDDDDSASSDGSYSDEDEDDSNDGSNDGSDGDEPRHRRSHMMAVFTGDSRTSRRNNTNTPRNDDKQSDTASVASGFTGWLSGGTAKATSPDRASYIANSRATTPEPSILAARGGPGHTLRSMSPASNASLTPRSAKLAPSKASPSRFTQLATSMSATFSRLTQHPPESPRSAGAAFENDELYHLNVDAALFPTGHPSERDAFSPSSFKNLEVNAASALQRLQQGYRERSVALHDMTAEKSVRDEELEEAETRAQHLKMQLEAMARRVADQQKDMEALMEELAAEQKARAQERAMFLSGIPTTPTAGLINGASSGSPPRERDDDQATSVVLSEDLDVDEAQRGQMRRQAWRRRSLKSDGSSIDDTDDGEGSTADDYESGSSMFSRSRSPTIAPSISFSPDNGAAGNDNHHQVPHPRVAALGSMRQSTRSVSSSSTATVVSQSQPMTTLQKLVKNVTGVSKDEEAGMPGTGTTSCQKCRGQDVSFAWNTVSILRDENKHLKQRVGQLEVAVEGALDMVNGVGV